METAAQRLAPEGSTGLLPGEVPIALDDAPDDTVCLIERELRVEHDPAAVNAVERCLMAQAGLACPEVIVTTAYFDTVPGSPPESSLEFVAQWAGGDSRLASSPVVVERRGREADWVSLQRLQLPRRGLRLAMRPNTRTELIPFFPPELRVVGAVRARRLLFLDWEGGYFAALDRGVELVSMSDALQPENVLSQLDTAVLTLRPLRDALPGWLEGLLQTGRSYAPLQQLRAALPGELELMDEGLPMADVVWLPDDAELDRILTEEENAGTEQDGISESADARNLRSA